MGWWGGWVKTGGRALEGAAWLQRRAGVGLLLTGADRCRDVAVLGGLFMGVKQRASSSEPSTVRLELRVRRPPTSPCRSAHDCRPLTPITHSHFRSVTLTFTLSTPHTCHAPRAAPRPVPPAARRQRHRPADAHHRHAGLHRAALAGRARPARLGQDRLPARLPRGAAGQPAAGRLARGSGVPGQVPQVRLAEGDRALRRAREAAVFGGGYVLRWRGFT